MVISPLSYLKNKVHTNYNLADHYLITETIDSTSQVNGVFGMGIITVSEGSLKAQINQSAYDITPGSFIVVNEGSLLTLKANKRSTMWLLLFKSSVAKVVAAELFHKRETDGLNYESIRNHQLVEHIHYINASLTDRLMILLKSGSSCASFQQLKSDGIVRSIIEDLSSKNLEAIQYSAKLPVKKEATRSDLYIRLSIAHDWLARSFKTALDMEAAAAVAMMSSAHFTRYFKMVYGITPYQYLLEIRMQWAQEQILNTTDSIQQIAQEICFETLSSFSYQFKKWCGLSPRQLRKSQMMN